MMHPFELLQMSGITDAILFKDRLQKRLLQILVNLFKKWRLLKVPVL